MSLVNIDPIAQGDNASPALWNQRFGAITAVLNGNIDSDNIKDGSISYSKMAGNALQAFYPVGSIYMNATDGTNPAGLFGFGTWQAFGSGRVPVGVDSTQTEFASAGQTGGDKNLQAHSHSGSTDVQGNHNHGSTANFFMDAGGGGNLNMTGGGNRYAQGQVNVTTTVNGAHAHNFGTSTAGTGNSGNLQPYITVYMWRRTA